LLKTHTLFEEDAENVGTLMLLLVITVFASLVAALVMEVHELGKWKQEIKHAKEEMDCTDEFDPALRMYVIDYHDIKLDKVIHYTLYTYDPYALFLYSPVQELGRGAEGVVRKGSYDGKAVAVKITVLSKMTVHLMVEILAEAQSEAKIMVQLIHQNVTQFCGVAMHYTDIEIHMLTILEFCPYGSIDDYITSNSARGRARSNVVERPEEKKLKKQHSRILDRLKAATKKGKSKTGNTDMVWEELTTKDKIELCQGIANGMACKNTGAALALYAVNLHLLLALLPFRLALSKYRASRP
jgi:hypothetical protein